MDRDFKDIPLSESNKSIKLADIQRRCEQLLEHPEDLDLSLEDGAPSERYDDPYNRS